MIKRSLILSFAIVCFSAVASRAEEVKITTYYPSPYGVYKGLSSTGDTNLATDATAKVGIGTTTPGKKLVVDKGAVVGDGIMIKGTNDTRVIIGQGQPTVWSWANGWATPGDFSLVEEGASGSRIYVKPGGNVGIGTTAPVVKLQVGNGYTNDGGFNIISWNDAKQTGIGIGYSSTGNTIQGRSGAGGVNNGDLLLNTYGGNVGIGTPTPQSPAPNGAGGNLDANDVYLRSTGKWASQSAAKINCIVQTNTNCNSVSCQVFCRADHPTCTGGGWYTYWGSNLDVNMPIMDGTNKPIAWWVVDQSWQSNYNGDYSKGKWTTYAVCSE